MARTEAVQGRRRRRAGTVSDVRSAGVAKALGLLARRADRMHFSPDRAALDRAGTRNGRLWRAISRFGIDEEVLAALRDRRGKLPPAGRNWHEARFAAQAESA